jgi:hypothetical protein
VFLLLFLLAAHVQVAGRRMLHLYLPVRCLRSTSSEFRVAITTHVNPTLRQPAGCATTSGLLPRGARADRPCCPIDAADRIGLT